MVFISWIKFSAVDWAENSSIYSSSRSDPGLELGSRVDESSSKEGGNTNFEPPFASITVRGVTSSGDWGKDSRLGAGIEESRR